MLKDERFIFHAGAYWRIFMWTSLRASRTTHVYPTAVPTIHSHVVVVRVFFPSLSVTEGIRTHRALASCCKLSHKL